MPGYDRLEIFYQLSHNLNTLATDKNLSDADALENLIDAYIIYSADNRKDLSILADKVRTSLSKALSVSQLSTTEEGAASFMSCLVDNDFAFLDTQSLRQSLSAIMQAQELKRRLQAKAEDGKVAPPSFDAKALDKLLRSAAQSQKQDKQSAAKQKKQDSTLDSIKTFILSEASRRLSAKKSPTAEDAFIAEHLDSLSSLRLEQDGKSNAFILTFAEGKTLRMPLYSRGKNYLLGMSTEALKNEKTVTAIYKTLQANGELSFTPTEPQQTSAHPKVKEKELKELLGIGSLKFTPEQKDAFKAELAAYNILQADATKLQALQSQLQAKYQMLIQNSAQAEQQQKLASLDKVITKNAKDADSLIKQGLQSLSPADCLSLLAPAQGHNQDAHTSRQAFGRLCRIFGTQGDKKLLEARQQVVDAVKSDGVLWQDFRNNYYELIKYYATDNYYRQLTDSLFNQELSVPEALRFCSTTLSPAVAKLVLLRSVELHCLGQDQIPDTKMMDKLHQALGYRIRRQEFKVSTRRQIRSKPLTAMLRSLADGRAFSLHGEVKFDIRDRLYINQNREEYRRLLGADANFEPLVGNVLDGKDADTSALSLTPYQRAYKTLGLLAGISKEYDNDKIDDTLFSQAYGVSGSSLPSLKAKYKWNRDDYLFKTYMELYYPSADLNGVDISAAKKRYQWADFKKHNSKAAAAVADEFKNNAASPQKLVSVLLAKGQWPAGDEDNSVHHNDPLKYAVASPDPLSYNRGNRLVVTVQWKPWEPDNHKFEHLTTIEGLDCHNPYLVAGADGSYKRYPQCDLREGMRICYEKPQVQKSDGSFEDVIPPNTLFLSSQGTRIPYPELPPAGREYSRIPPNLVGAKVH